MAVLVAVVIVPSADTAIGSDAGTVASKFAAYALLHKAIIDMTLNKKACKSFVADLFVCSDPISFSRNQRAFLCFLVFQH